jgi:hypothetical protein
MQIAATFKLSANITNCTVTSFPHSTQFYFVYRQILTPQLLPFSHFFNVVQMLQHKPDLKYSVSTKYQ